MRKKIISCGVSEQIIENLNFNIYKFSSRVKPKNIKDTLIVCCFSEFGCETLGCMYCMPVIFEDFDNKYKIAVGWYGREYLYRDLVDEFWEIKKEYMWLKEYSRAFHHVSKNLSKLEKKIGEFGVVLPSSYMGTVAVCAKCNDCRSFFVEKHNKCEKCKSTNYNPSLLKDVNFWKPKAKKIPEPSEIKKNLAKKYIKDPCVAIFARGRNCYGRNLQPDFYIKLIIMLEKMGYNPIWLGEEESVQSCPVSRIVDFSRKKESKDLETTLAIVKQCEFTIQFWTASTRLAGMLGVPYILFESPDQIWGRGQEGTRRKLCDFGPSKLSINHFLNVYNNNDKGLEIVKKCIEELLNKNYNDIIGLVESESLVSEMKNKFLGGHLV